VCVCVCERRCSSEDRAPVGICMHAKCRKQNTFVDIGHTLYTHTCKQDTTVSSTDCAHTHTHAQTHTRMRAVNQHVDSHLSFCLSLGVR